ncbi:IclR family transcriptional regulator C-terminal domain-containing protein [Novosphingobium sp. BL-52-GroH]|uniref:IclR family transcriptional regulator domain-containing protein n=1 Tax=Novosphingobium sp. BL-52-GroH TaxID=3349877 RepID=UPI00384F63DE
MNMDATTSGAVPIRAVARALEVLKTISRLGSPTILEIKEACRLPYATAYRMVMTLLSEGYIECEPSRKRYRPTELVWSLVSGFQRDDVLVVNAREELVHLTSRVLWPVALSVRIGNKMIIKDSTHPLTTQTFSNYYPGYSMPLFECGAGKAYVAFCPTEERERLFEAEKIFPADENDFLQAHQIIHDETYIEQIRRQGYATHARAQHNETPGKTSTIAVPVHVNGNLRACLGLVYFDKAMTMQDATARYADLLKDAASRIGSKVAAAEMNSAIP